ncbi:MAG: TIGR02147 family protein [Bdellovibrionales bacterium]|nr:TIGR02147 family protein [Bdellovibrionales bacterium]
MKVPNLRKYHVAVDFFSDLYDQNKRSRSTFSHRSFAKKVGWPASYLADLLKKRRKLTVTRALQFASAVKLTPAETEHLILMCLAEFEDLQVADHFKTLLLNRSLPAQRQVSFKKYLGLFENLRAMYLRELILWGQGQMRLSQLLKANLAFPELRDSQVLKETLDFLTDRQLVRATTTADTYVVVENAVFALDDDLFTNAQPQDLAQHYIRQLEILSRLYRRYRGVGFSFSGYIDIRKDRAAEIQKRLFELRDWLISLSQEAKSTHLKENETLQCELHLLPLFDFTQIPPFSP